MITISDSSTAWLTITFKDREGKNEVPASFQYRIDTLQGAEIRDWVEVNTPTSPYEITLTPSDNAIYDTGEPEYQQNIITVKAIFGAGDQRTDEYSYRVRNLSKI